MNLCIFCKKPIYKFTSVCDDCYKKYDTKDSIELAEELEK